MKFKCKDTQSLYQGEFVKKFSSITRVAERKLQAIDMAVEVTDLRSPPGNRFEALKGDRLGTYSIRINSQFRICFAWQDDEAFDVEIVDYY